MAPFRKSIIVNRETFDFEFSEVCNPSGLKYFVTVYEGCKQIISFEMKRTASGWNIVPPAPEWVNQLQEKLGRAIDDNINTEI